jgi:glycosyltransferase involved in cell wall biosynthesis
VWNIYSLLDEFKLGDVTTVSNRESDDWLAHAYSACDATMAIGAGEGFGYPIVESIACGTPAVHGRYAGGRELCALGPLAQAWRLEGPANVQRPVYDPHAMYSSVMTTTISKMQDSADHLHWDKLWPVWEKWFREGACAS